MLKDYWFIIKTEDGDLEGEEFFVECYTREEAFSIAKDNFPNETLKCLGCVSRETAEEMGLDTY